MFRVAQQLLGSDATGLYQAWDKAILLDQVFGSGAARPVMEPGVRL